MIPSDLFSELTPNITEANIVRMTSKSNSHLRDALSEFVSHAMCLIDGAAAAGKMEVYVDGTPTLRKESTIGLPDLGSLFMIKGYDVAYPGDNMLLISWDKDEKLREVKKDEAEI